jgi:hypothetical protein
MTLQFIDVRNVIKKEIWKLVIKGIKEIKDVLQAKNAKQVFFYDRLGLIKKEQDPYSAVSILIDWRSGL